MNYDVFNDLALFHHNILKWYEQYGRKFPWRESVHSHTNPKYYQDILEYDAMQLAHESQSVEYKQSYNISSSLDISQSILTQKQNYHNLEFSLNHQKKETTNNIQEFTTQRAYRVWVSEVMLQQTQTKRVLESYYFQFLKKFPSLSILALSTEENILKMWQGLGYYSRARNLHATAQKCLKYYNATLPNEVKALRKLPGIGDYTAGAIACFGYGQCVSFVDSNIARLLKRLFAIHVNQQNATLQKILNTLAHRILNIDESFKHNQAIIDIGAMICLPQNPKCSICPLFCFCLGKNTSTLLRDSKKISYQNKTINLLLISKNTWRGNQQTIEFALFQSSAKLYKNLYGFIEVSDDELNLFLEHLSSINMNYITDNISIQQEQNRFYQFSNQDSQSHIQYTNTLSFLGRFKHTYTKYRLEVKVYFCNFEHYRNNKINISILNLLESFLQNKIKNNAKQSEKHIFTFYSLSDIENLAVSSLTLKALQLYKNFIQHYAIS
ncbi:hypothetical protein CQA53_07760 [Helicobacter didelphidarum]|uniref:HhH-GPD domain-containing protein n=1 Tax=Helicobacter didelphidarum TaxID=2040648 RepID=A0A3D8IH28_9HELI|nr:hypothetical protein [Helicobacter didelphidarum]RDU64216.1 hypothetical protein CQA53_07760 [Helicobacter didelphidarum]